MTGEKSTDRNPEAGDGGFVGDARFNQCANPLMESLRVSARSGSGGTRSSCPASVRRISHPGLSPLDRPLVCYGPIPGACRSESSSAEGLLAVKCCRINVE